MITCSRLSQCDNNFVTKNRINETIFIPMTEYFNHLKIQTITTVQHLCDKNGEKCVKNQLGMNVIACLTNH